MDERHIIKYPNGATFIYLKQEVSESTDIVVGFNCGANCDEKQLEGTAHAVEHCLFHGTDTLKKEELYKFLKQTGTIYNAYTSQEFIASTFNCPSINFKKIIKVNSDMFAKKSFDETEWNRERKVILQELFMTMDKQEETFYKIHAIERLKTAKDIIGSPASLAKITTKDLERFKNNYFITDNMVVTVVTNLPFEEVKAEVENNFINRFPSNALNKVNIRKLHYKDMDMYSAVDLVNQSFKIDLSFKGVDDVEEDYAYSLFEGWLFNGFDGILMNNMRLQLPLVYTAHFTSIPARNANYKNFSILTSPENAKSCIYILANALRDLIDNPITEEELAEAKESVKQSLSRNTKILPVANQIYQNYMFEGKAFNDGVEKFMSLTTDDVNNYIRKIYGYGKIFLSYAGDMVRSQDLPSITDYPYRALTDNALKEKLDFDWSKASPLPNVLSVLRQFTLRTGNESVDKLMKEFKVYGADVDINDKKIITTQLEGKMRNSSNSIKNFYEKKKDDFISFEDLEHDIYKQVIQKPFKKKDFSKVNYHVNLDESFEK